MTPEEYADMIGFLEGHWGTLHRGWIGQQTALYADFRDYPKAVATDAVQELFYSGSAGCPSPSKVVAKLREKTALRGRPGERDPRYCGDRHTWGFEVNDAGEREATCAVCGTEHTFTERQLRTPLEIAEGPPTAEPPDDAVVPF